MKTSGRPRIYTDQEEPMIGKTVRLTHWHERRAKKMGNGNLSEGIRNALEESLLHEKEKR